MAVTVKSARELGLMRDSGKILAEVHAKLGEFVKPGISTLEIDQLGEKLIRGYDCVPNFLHYNGYPASICVSVNDEVVHGIPKADRILQEGDIVSLDAGLIYKGYHSDAARTYPVGKVSEEAQLLIDRTKQSFFEGIKMAVAGNHLYDISNRIDDYISQFGYQLNRVAEDQARNGVHVDPSDLQPGDILCFYSNGYIGHVGMYIGNGQFVHAANSRSGVIITDLTTGYYATRGYEARRIV